MRRAIQGACLLLILSCVPAFAQDAKLVKKYNHWLAYVSTVQPKTCFVVSQPISMAPKDVKRDPVYFYVAKYPSEKVNNEISIKMGYPLKSGDQVTVSVGSSVFKLYTKNEGAFVDTRADEDKLVTAMKAGSKMTITGVSTRGTKTTDHYSLSGISAALSRADKECS